MDRESLSEIAESLSPDDDVFYLKPDVKVEEAVEDTDNQLSQNFVCWKRDFGHEVCSIAVHPHFPDNAHVAIGNCGDVCVIHDFSTQNNDESEDGELKTLGPFGDTISSCAYSPDGKVLSLGCLDGAVYVYKCDSVDNYKTRIALDPLINGVEWLCWTSNSDGLLFGGDGHNVVLWLPKSNITHCIATSTNSQSGMIVNYSTSLAVACCDDGNMFVSELNKDYSPLNTHKINLCTTGLISLDCHHSVQLAIVGSACGGVYFVNLSKFKIAASALETHTSSVECVKFQNSQFSDTHIAASCSRDGTVVFWDCCKYIKLSSVSTDIGLTKLVWHPTKNLIAVGDLSGGVSIIKFDKVIRETQPHKEPILDMAILPCSPHDYAIITASQDFSASM